jgi:hypothetical protein
MAGQIRTPAADAATRKKVGQPLQFARTCGLAFVNWERSKRVGGGGGALRLCQFRLGGQVVVDSSSTPPPPIVTARAARPANAASHLAAPRLCHHAPPARRGHRKLPCRLASSDTPCSHQSLTL